MSDQTKQGLLSPFLRGRRLAAARPWLNGRVLDFACGGGALAGLVPPNRYLGVDIDAAALNEAIASYPEHTFAAELAPDDAFDTVVALAFIEHVADPRMYLRRFAAWLRPGGRIVLTTPHPLFRRAHDAGARLSVFSADASDEHEVMLSLADMRPIAVRAGLRVEQYRRFLFGANQLFVLSLSFSSD